MLETHTENALQEAEFALQTSPEFALRSLHVEQVDDNLILSGTVSTFYHKQLAQEVIRSVCEGMGVINLVEVIAHDPRRAGTLIEEPAHAS